MAGFIDAAFVNIWGRTVGAVAWDRNRGYATFEYDPDFLNGGLDLAPLHMPLQEALQGGIRFAFPRLPYRTFLGLPGLLADALPDRFGNHLIDAWLAGQGRRREDFNPVWRLCYIGSRGMGALEFASAVRNTPGASVPVQIDELVALARKVLHPRQDVQGDLGRPGALTDILRVGTSAGGARPKAVIAVNDKTGEVRSGQVPAPPGFTHWILKFDGVRDRELDDPDGYGRIEYAYHLMAVAAGITMTPCRLLEENGRAHFMTRRFDRTEAGGRLHLQTLCGLAHLDFSDPVSHSYEQAFQVCREIRLPYTDQEQLYRRMVFNAAARNQDDHTKNIGFLMDLQGEWRLSPAYDVTYAYNPGGRWTHRHQMSMAGKHDHITRADLLAVARAVGIRKPASILEEVGATLEKWPEFAAAAGVPERQATGIGATFRNLDMKNESRADP